MSDDSNLWILSTAPADAEIILTRQPAPAVEPPVADAPDKAEEDPLALVAPV